MKGSEQAKVTVFAPLVVQLAISVFETKSSCSYPVDETNITDLIVLVAKLPATRPSAFRSSTTDTCPDTGLASKSRNGKQQSSASPCSESTTAVTTCIATAT